MPLGALGLHWFIQSGSLETTQILSFASSMIMFGVKLTKVPKVKELWAQQDTLHQKLNTGAGVPMWDVVRGDGVERAEC